MDCSSKILRICVCIVHSVHCQSHKFRSWCPTLTRSRSLETFKGRSRSPNFFKTLESESESESHKKMRTPHPWSWQCPTVGSMISCKHTQQPIMTKLLKNVFAIYAPSFIHRKKSQSLKKAQTHMILTCTFCNSTLLTGQQKQEVGHRIYEKVNYVTQGHWRWYHK